MPSFTLNDIAEGSDDEVEEFELHKNDGLSQMQKYLSRQH
jgi:hypothetical protein